MTGAEERDPRFLRRFGKRILWVPRWLVARLRRSLVAQLRLQQHSGRTLYVPKRYLRTSPPPRAPLVSIVTPSFNQSGFLEHTIRSVLGQGYPALEYIVQDGGSKDGSVEILKKHADRLHYWQSKPDSGQAAAINLGFSQANGEILGFLNADDILLPGAVSYVADYFAKHPNVDAVYSHRVIIDAAGRETGRWVLPRHDDRTLRWADYVPQETLFWRREIWERSGGAIDESLHFAIDWEMLMRFIDAGAVIKRVPRFLSAFRVHTDQKTSAIIGDVGFAEMSALRTRIHGRAVSDREVRRAVTPFVVRQFAYAWTYHAGLLRP